MGVHNPQHFGEFFAEVLGPNGPSGRELAASLAVAASTLSRVLKGTSEIGSEMPLNLAKSLGRSPERWLAIQTNHDPWLARQHVDLGKVSKVRLTAA